MKQAFASGTMKFVESRKGLFLGPFCPIYGVGAVILIFALDRFKDNKVKLAIYGALLGSIVEYILSFMLEAIYGARFWDYGWVKYNLNGRICTVYSFFWALLSLFVICVLKKQIDKIICKIGKDEEIKENQSILDLIKNRKIMDLGIFIFFIINVFITIWAITAYQTRVLNEYYHNEEKDENSIIRNIEDTIFSNEKMLITFPNLRVRDNDGNELFVRDILNNIN